MLRLWQILAAAINRLHLIPSISLRHLLSKVLRLLSLLLVDFQLLCPCNKMEITQLGLHKWPYNNNISMETLLEEDPVKCSCNSSGRTYETEQTSTARLRVFFTSDVNVCNWTQFMSAQTNWSSWKIIYTQPMYWAKIWCIVYCIASQSRLERMQSDLYSRRYRRRQQN